ncbi:hypothetical protein HDZ31DRAFT_33659 [Schizophyllum fasciatum]
MSFTSPPPYKASVAKHATYYFPEGNMSVLIDDTLFRIWTATFRMHSSSFEKQYPSYRDTSDSSPLRLDNVTANEFEKLLWVLYPPAFDQERPKIVADWLAILKLSTMWNLVSARNLAIRRLATLNVDPVQQIVIQIQYGVDTMWAYEAFRSLCKRREPLSVLEGNEVGLEVVTKVAVARERLAKTWTKPERIVREVWELPVL